MAATELEQDTEDGGETKPRYDPDASLGIKICIIVVVSAICLGVGFALGFWFVSRYDFPHDIASLNPSNGASSSSSPPPPSSTDYEFDINASNLTVEDETVIRAADTMCAHKQCCREDDEAIISRHLSKSNQSSTDSRPRCYELTYLQCLSLDNKCVWDCHQPWQLSHSESSPPLTFLRRFRGISKHDGVPFPGKPKVPFHEILQRHNDSTAHPLHPETELKYVTVDECGTIYDHELTKESAQRERAKLSDYYQQFKPPKPLHLPHLDLDRAGLFKRRLGGILGGSDGRSAVTSWQWPYHRNLYIEFATGNPYEYARCSGAWISPIHILTAGHCISDGNGHFFAGFMGAANYNAGKYEIFQDYDDLFVFSEWHYSSNWDFDLAIIKTKQRNSQFGYFEFAESSSIDAAWKFDVNGYPEDKGWLMQRQDVFMDFAVYPEVLYTGSGDVIDGNSGGPAWYSNDYKVYGVASHTVSLNEYMGTVLNPPMDIANGFTRITKAKLDSMCAFMRKSSETW
eukprot:CAMPEP_0197053088 /NCGR_PEP_ID=MMETSP1384-20130603/27439_1 /TAXON_ID=29189 /ORGANISM="Ammonia sp." /LENGTH=513 /DNA_ID=CAMNT_0042485933 /DNA_START=1 /DNA_END=1539 /DNA_ORIENTATION=-